MLDEYDIMRERFCSYREAQTILQEMQEMRAKQAEEALLNAEKEASLEEIIAIEERRQAAETLLRLGATEEMIKAGAIAGVTSKADNAVDVTHSVWNAMLREAVGGEA